MAIIKLLHCSLSQKVDIYWLTQLMLFRKRQYRSTKSGSFMAPLGKGKNINNHRLSVDFLWHIYVSS